MAAKCPVFPISQSFYQLGDYDFDPQIQYLKVLEEARLRERRPGPRVSQNHVLTDSPNKNQKQQNRQEEEAERLTKKKGSKWRWWNRRSLFFWKTKRLGPQTSLSSSLPTKSVRAYSGPIYGSAELLPSRKSLPSTPVGRGGGGEDAEVFNVPYLSFKELTMSPHHRRFSTSSPIYLVT